MSVKICIFIIESIRIYHSPWRILLLALPSLAFAVAYFLMAIHSTKDIFYSLKSLGFAPKFVWT